MQLRQPRLAEKISHNLGMISRNLEKGGGRPGPLGASAHHAAERPVAVATSPPAAAARSPGWPATPTSDASDGSGATSPSVASSRGARLLLFIRHTIYTWLRMLMTSVT